MTDDTQAKIIDGKESTGSVVKTCKILHLLAQRKTPLRLTDVVRLTGINKATAYRILRCLVAYKMVGRTPRSEYVSMMPGTNGVPCVKIGYAAQTDEFAFSRAVTGSIEAAAARAGIELIMLDNAYSPTVALQNAEALIKQNIDIVIEFQTDASIAGLISAKLQARHVPMIAIEIPHPNAVYFGINNIQAGLTAGRHLARWAAEHWQGKVELLVLLGLPMAGSLPGSRLTGTLLGLREMMPDFDDKKVMTINGEGRHKQSFEMVHSLLQQTKSKRILVSAINDPSALGALEAFRTCRRESDCAVMGQNASTEALEEMRSPSTRLVGSVGYFPEKYGDQVINLAIDIVQGKRTPSAVFVKHHLITPGNVQSYYPVIRKRHPQSSQKAN